MFTRRVVGKGRRGKPYWLKLTILFLRKRELDLSVVPVKRQPADYSSLVAKRRETAYTNKLFRVVAERPVLPTDALACTVAAI